jgi:hypothetical protein
MSESAPTWLTPAEVEELTACKRRDVQCKRLAAMQIPFRPNYAGRPLVVLFRSGKGGPLVERAAVLAYKERPAGAQQRKPAEPDWDAMEAA